MEDSSGGYLYFDDSGCDKSQTAKIETAVWHASNLAQAGSKFLESTEGNLAAWYYIGPNWQLKQERISGNLKRVAQFKKKPDEDIYITISCKDPKNYCNKDFGPKSVGGYAWSTHRALGRWIATNGIEDKIVDEYIQNVPHNGAKRPSDKKAYGPVNVYKLAHRSLIDGGGATRASTNADNYAMLANAVWWRDATHYFPGVPANPIQQKADGSSNLVFLHAKLNDVDPSTADFTKLFNDDPSIYADDSTPPTSTAAPAPSATPPPPANICGTWYKFIYDHFEIYGRDFNPTKFGENGAALKKQIEGCGKLNSWSFEHRTNNPQGYQWFAKGDLPIGTKSCVGRAVVSAGGSNVDGRKGPG
ncbi:MAG: hypothetical protein M1814_003263 [Vezdaea aestivalis]|nr:MAG: hypothetical protein M1814_003263 [Vezdaea aestivalis]